MHEFELPHKNWFVQRFEIYLLKALGLLQVLGDQLTRPCFHNFAMIWTCTYMFSNI